MSLSNSVFISYRRDVSGYPARAVFQDLRANQIDAFLDIANIDSGQFDTIILNQIAARPYFLVILGPGCLERCADPSDWLRREIEYAMEHQREIIPLLTSEFKFSAPYAAPYLTGKLEHLSRYNAVNVPLDYFEEAMIRLRTRFLKPIERQLTLTPKADQATVQTKIDQAAAEPPVTDKQLSAQEYFERAKARPDTDLDGQVDDYTHAIQLNAEYAAAYYNRGLALQAKGELDTAIADYSDALRLNPYYNFAYNNRGLARQAKGELDAAIADFNEALRINPQYADAYINRSIARSDKGDLSGAIADDSEAIRLNPQNADAYYNRAIDYDAQGNKKRAAEDYQQVLRLNANYPEADAMRKYIKKHLPSA